MASPLLHTRVRDSVEFSQSPEQLLDELEGLAGQEYRMAVDVHDADNIEFEIERGNTNRPDILISGIIRRWHGTESRLDFMGEVDVPAPNVNRQQGLVLLVVLALSVAFWQFVIMDIGGIVAFSNSGRAILGVIVLWLAFTIISGWVSYGLIVRDTNSKKRWQVQQEMAQFIEDIQSLASTNVNTSRLVETEKVETITVPLAKKHHKLNDTQ